MWRTFALGDCNTCQPISRWHCGSVSVWVSASCRRCRLARQRLAQSGPSEKEAFEAAKSLGTVEAWDAFLWNYPTGFHADLARAYVKKLSETTPSPAPSQGAAPSISANDDLPAAAGSWGGVLRDGPGRNYTTDRQLERGRACHPDGAYRCARGRLSLVQARNSERQDRLSMGRHSLLDRSRAARPVQDLSLASIAATPRPGPRGFQCACRPRECPRWNIDRARSI